MKEKSFESRRVRTQPCTRTFGIGAVACNASFTGIGRSASVMAPIIALKARASDSLERSFVGKQEGSPADRQDLPFRGVGEVLRHRHSRRWDETSSSLRC